MSFYSIEIDVERTLRGKGFSLKVDKKYIDTFSDWDSLTEKIKGIEKGEEDVSNSSRNSKNGTKRD